MASWFYWSSSKCPWTQPYGLASRRTYQMFYLVFNEPFTFSLIILYISKMFLQMIGEMWDNHQKDDIGNKSVSFARGQRGRIRSIQFWVLRFLFFLRYFLLLILHSGKEFRLLSRWNISGWHFVMQNMVSQFFPWFWEDRIPVLTAKMCIWQI